MTIAKEIRSHRIKAKISMRRLAIMSGLAPETIGKIEHGKTTNIGVETLSYIAKALNIKLTDLLKEAA